MTRSLAIGLTVTDVAFLGYWALTAAFALGWIDLPADLLYSNYHDPRVVGWNWSFFPLDIAFSLTGLAAVRLAAKGDPLWRPMALVSLTLSSTAGLMAVSYWTVMGEFEPVWFGINLALFLWPLFFIPKLMCDMAPRAH
jgi:Family of unknown function (DUF5360)